MALARMLLALQYGIGLIKWLQANNQNQLVTCMALARMVLSVAGSISSASVASAVLKTFSLMLSSFRAV